MKTIKLINKLKSPVAAVAVNAVFCDHLSSTTTTYRSYIIRSLQQSNGARKYSNNNEFQPSVLEMRPLQLIAP